VNVTGENAETHYMWNPDIVTATYSDTSANEDNSFRNHIR